MNQPPDDDFYNDSTANTGFPPQQRPGQPPVPPWPQPAPNNYPRQGPPGGQPWQPGPMNQPQLTPPPQGPASQPGFGPPNAARPGQPGWDNMTQNAGAPSQRPPGYPPPSGPISRPGFSNTSRPLDANPFAATDPAPLRPGNNPQSGNPVAPWGPPPQQQPGPGPAPWNQSPQVGPAPWNQPPQTPPPGPTPWNQPQNDAPPNWNNQPPQPATPPKKSRLGLIITLVIITLVVVIGGASGLLYLRSTHGGSASTGTPTAQSTASTSGLTPVATRSAGTTPTTSSGGLNAIGTPVQAGNDWLVTVTSVKETSTSLVPPGANNTYLEINLTLKNTSGGTLSLVSYLFFTLDNGKHETLGDTNIRHTPDGSVSANQTLNAQIAFEVPKSQHTFTFTFAYGLSHNTNAAVSWQLTA